MSSRSYRVAAMAALLFSMFWMVACGGGGDGAAGSDTSEEMVWLRSAKADLDAKRAELAELRAEALAQPVEVADDAEATDDAEASDEADEAEPAAVEEGAAEPAMSLDEQITKLENEIANQAEEFGGRLVNHINALAIDPEVPLTPEQQEAIRMKSSEDIEVAKEWIEKGGDYRRAIEIYQQQLQWDPDNEALKTAMANAEAMRYVTQERFDEVQDGMSQSDVRALLGPVNLHNVREYPDRNVVAWFYIKSEEEGGGAAGIYFRLDDKTGQYAVYQRNYEVNTEE